jgi:hypothetical protein
MMMMIMMMMMMMMIIIIIIIMSHAVAQLVEALRYKVAGSIPDGVIGIFRGIILPTADRTVALGLTQLLPEMSTRNISWEVKATGV